MCIVVGNVNAFMAYSIGNSNRRKTLFNQKADVAMSQIVDSDALDSGGLGAS